VYSVSAWLLPSQNRIPGTFFNESVRNISRIGYEVIGVADEFIVEHVEGVAFLVHYEDIS
jgi:hypothetical protein